MSNDLTKEQFQQLIDKTRKANIEKAFRKTGGEYENKIRNKLNITHPKAAFDLPVLYIITPVNLQRPVKIGISITPYRRLAAIQGANWQQLEIYKLFQIGKQARKLERHLHFHLKDKKLTGEWFDVESFEADQIVQAYFRANLSKFRG